MCMFKKNGGDLHPHPHPPTHPPGWSVGSLTSAAESGQGSVFGKLNHGKNRFIKNYASKPGLPQTEGQAVSLGPVRGDSN